jgi:predicted enzyme related to lactoylglutathione lyase
MGDMSNLKHPTLTNGKICYIELPAKSVAESSVFYEKIFGWKTRTRGDGSVAFDDAVNQVSGTWRTDRKSSPEPGLLVYIMVDDVESTMKAVVANGGKIVQPVGMDSPEITARFTDPAGNVLGLYQE